MEKQTEFNKHARAAVKAILGKYQGGYRYTHVISATGTGKTNICYEAAIRAVKPVTQPIIVVTFPTKALIAEALLKWQNPQHVLRRNGLPPVVVEPSEYQYCVVSGDSKDDLTEMVKSGLPLIVFTTNSSFARKVAGNNALRRRRDDVLLIVDEAHHATVLIPKGASTMEFGRFAQAIHSFDNATKREGYRRKLGTRKLFVTATPKHSDKTDFEMRIGMRDESHFGPCAYEFKFTDAVARGIASDYKIHIAMASPKSFTKAMRKAALATTIDKYGRPDSGHTVAGKPMTERELIARQAILNAISKGNQRVMAYFQTVEAARRFSEHYFGPSIKAVYISGKMSRDKINEALGTLEHLGNGAHSAYILCSCRTVGEGVDVPAVDTVAFVDMHRSPVDIIQRVGRGTRMTPSGRLTDVIIPLLVSDDYNGNQNEIFEQEGWGPVREILTGLQNPELSMVVSWANLAENQIRKVSKSGTADAPVYEGTFKHYSDLFPTTLYTVTGWITDEELITELKSYAASK